MQLQFLKEARQAGLRIRTFGDFQVFSVMYIFMRYLQVHIRDMKIVADYDYKNGNGHFTAELDIIAKNARYAVAGKTDCCRRYLCIESGCYRQQN